MVPAGWQRRRRGRDGACPQRVNRPADVGGRIDHRRGTAGDGTEEQPVVFRKAGHPRPVAHPQVPVWWPLHVLDEHGLPPGRRMESPQARPARWLVVAEHLGTGQGAGIELSVVRRQPVHLGAVAHAPEVDPASRCFLIAGDLAKRPRANMQRPSELKQGMDLAPGVTIAERVAQVGPRRSLEAHHRGRVFPGSDHQPAFVDRHGVRKGGQLLCQLPAPVTAIHLHGEVVADGVQVACVRGHREDPLGVARLSAVHPAAHAIEPIDPAWSKRVVCHPRPVIRPGGRVQRVAMDDQRPDAAGAERRHLTGVLPVSAAKVAVDVGEVRFRATVRAARVQHPLEHSERRHVVGRRRWTPAIDPLWVRARIESERNSQLVARSVVAARARNGAQVEPGSAAWIEPGSQDAGGPGAVLRNVEPQRDREVPIQPNVRVVHSLAAPHLPLRKVRRSLPHELSTSLRRPVDSRHRPCYRAEPVC